MEVHNATTNETKKAAQKSLCTAIHLAKKEWANGLLHNAMTESLWKATRWHHSRRQRTVPALATDNGLSDNRNEMTNTLKKRFFKDNPPPVNHILPNDP